MRHVIPLTAPSVTAEELSAALPPLPPVAQLSTPQQQHPQASMSDASDDDNAFHFDPNLLLLDDKATQELLEGLPLHARRDDEDATPYGRSGESRH